LAIIEHRPLREEPTMGRSVLAVVAGALVWAVLWVGGTSQMPTIFPGVVQGEPLRATGPLLALIAYSVVLSVLAGWTTGRTAPSRPVRHATILAGIQLALGIAFEVSAWALTPAWYHLVFLALIVPATVYGGRLAAGRAR
jgi:hypothetical protein